MSNRIKLAEEVVNMVEYDDDKAEEIAVHATELLAKPATEAPLWTVRAEGFNGLIFVHLPEPDNDIRIAFGGVNETFGASVSSADGEDLAYLESNLDQDTASVEQLANAIILLVRQWLDDGRPDSVELPTREQLIQAARDLYQNDDIEIDDDAKLSGEGEGLGGTWVQAWVWVNHEEIQRLADKNVHETQV